MSKRADDLTYDEITIFGIPALFTDLRVDRSTVPDGVYCYELRHAVDREILRFRLSDYNTHRIGVVLDGLHLPERHFTAQPNFLRQCKMFITQDEIDRYFLRQSIDTRLNVYSHFCRFTDTAEHQKFIKALFGEYSGGGRAGYQHTKTGKGLDYERDYSFKKYDSVHLTIPNVVKEYEHLIAQKRFPGEDAIAKIPEYERRQVARAIYSSLYNAPDNVPRPYYMGGKLRRDRHCHRVVPGGHRLSRQDALRQVL